MVIFHSYVKLPEGITSNSSLICHRKMAWATGFPNAVAHFTNRLVTSFQGLLLCPGVDLCNHVSVAPTAKVQVKVGGCCAVTSRWSTAFPMGNPVKTRCREDFCSDFSWVPAATPRRTRRKSEILGVSHPKTGGIREWAGWSHDLGGVLCHGAGRWGQHQPLGSFPRQGDTNRGFLDF